MGLRCKAHWADVATLAVRMRVVVMVTEVRDDHPSFAERPELLLVEALVTEASVEALDEAILPGACQDRCKWF